jgi:LysR family transcriptional regulator, nitrogen assimilation regulatory protein
MKFEDLEAFYEVAKHQSFSKAAASLRTAQSALSRRVARLEHQFGLKLFNRHGRGVRMTAEGQALLDRSDGLMHELGSIESFGRGLSAEPAGKIVVAFTPTSGQILGPLVLQAIQKYPKLTLELKEGFTGAIHDWLSRGLIDVAVLYDPEQAAGLDILPLLREPLLLAGAPHMIAALRHKSYPVKELDRLPLVLPSRSHSLRRLLDRLADQKKLRLQLRNQVDGMRTIKGIVEAGLGYTIFCYAGLYEEIRAGTLKTIPFSPPLAWTFCLVSLKESRNSAAVRAVRETIISQVHQLVDGGLWQGTLLVKQR